MHVLFDMYMHACMPAVVPASTRINKEVREDFNKLVGIAVATMHHPASHRALPGQYT
jgi:hypothetical protein